MRISKLARQLPPWLYSNSNESDIVLSSFLGLSRNIEGFPFTTKIPHNEKAQLTRFIKEKILQSLPTYNYQAIDLDSTQECELLTLEERQLIPTKIKDLENLELLLTKDERSSILINHRDHLRLKMAQKGLSLSTLWKMMDHLDDELSHLFPYSYHNEFGFLTSHTSNVGTGLFCEVLVHLPAFVFTGKINKKITELIDDHILIKHFFTYSNVPLGNLYLISNRQSIGMSETDIIKKVEDCVQKIANEEKSLREKVLEANKSDIKDKTFRSLGILTNSHAMPLQESLSLLSIFKFGLDQKIIKDISKDVWNEIIINGLPGHLQLKHLKSDKKLEHLRSQYIASAINNSKNDS